MSERKYIKPNGWQRWFNNVAGKLGFATVITVRGRTSGEPRSATIIPITIADQEYLVAPRGETDWARNLRASGEATLRKRSKSRHITAQEIDGDERVTIIDAYKKKLGRMVAREFDPLPDPADHPTFRITTSS